MRVPAAALRLWPPVAPPTTLGAWLAGRAPAAPGWVLTPQAEGSLRQLAERGSAGAADLLVGPESGLSADEVAMAARAGLTPARLGPRVLRTETAGLTAIALLQSVLGDLV